MPLLNSRRREKRTDRRAEAGLADDGFAAGAPHRPQERVDCGRRLVACAGPHHPGNVGQRLHVLHDGGITPVAAHSDERRPEPRPGGLTFEDFDEGGLLADQVVVRPDDDINGWAVRNEFDQLFSCVFEAGGQSGESTSEKQRGLTGTKDRSSDAEALQHHVRMLGKQVGVLDAARFVFTAVADHDPRPRPAHRQTPLGRGGKVRSPATADIGGIEKLNDLGGLRDRGRKAGSQTRSRAQQARAVNVATVATVASALRRADIGSGR